MAGLLCRQTPFTNGTFAAPGSLTSSYVTWPRPAPAFSSVLRLTDFLELVLDVPREHEFGRPLLVERDLRAPSRLRCARRAAPRPAPSADCSIASVTAVASKPRMHHAVGALLVIADAVGVPVGVFHQLLEGLGVAFAEQVAGPLPAEDGARRVAPRRAVIGLVAGEEVEEQAGLAERPVLAAVAAR